MIGSISVLMAMTSLSGGAHAAIYDISWSGANGYSMQGRFGFSDSLLGSGHITASNLTSFSFSLYSGSTTLGSWDAFANGLAAGYKFNFNFDTTTGQFLTGGNSASATGQDWDVVTGGSRCPSTGVGFSSGSYGQVLCVHGLITSASMVLVKNSTLSVQPFGPPVPHTLPTPPAVPLPPAAWLLGSGLLALAGASRKQQASRQK